MFPPSLRHVWQLITVGRRDVTRLRRGLAYGCTKASPPGTIYSIHKIFLITKYFKDQYVTRIKQKAALASSFFNVETEFPDRQAFVQPYAMC